MFDKLILSMEFLGFFKPHEPKKEESSAETKKKTDDLSHIKNVVERGSGRIASERAKVEKSAHELTERMNRVLQNINNKTFDAESFKSEIAPHNTPKHDLLIKGLAETNRIPAVVGSIIRKLRNEDLWDDTDDFMDTITDNLNFSSFDVSGDDVYAILPEYYETKYATNGVVKGSLSSGGYNDTIIDHAHDAVALLPKNLDALKRVNSDYEKCCSMVLNKDFVEQHDYADLFIDAIAVLYLSVYENIVSAYVEPAVRIAEIVSRHYK